VCTVAEIVNPVAWRSFSTLTPSRSRASGKTRSNLRDAWSALLALGIDAMAFPMTSNIADVVDRNVSWNRSLMEFTKTPGLTPSQREMEHLCEESAGSRCVVALTMLEDDGHSLCVAILHPGLIFVQP